MATYNRDQFIRQVLIDLTILDANEAPEAEDSEQIEGRTQQKFEELYEDGLIPFDLDEDIPARYFLPLVSVVCAECITAYGLGHLTDELEGEAARGMRQLWKLRQRAYFHTPVAVNYF